MAKKKRTSQEIISIFLKASKAERAEWKRKAEIKLLANILIDLWCDENGVKRSELAGHPDNSVKDFIDQYMPYAQKALRSFNSLISKPGKITNFKVRRAERAHYIQQHVLRVQRWQNPPKGASRPPKQP